MTTPEFVTASLQEHRSDLLSLNVAYMSWVFAGIDKFFGVRRADVVGMDASDYVASVLDKLCGRSPPEGIFYLVKRQGQFSAMGGLRGLSADTAEVKRIYVHPESRGANLGELILERLLDDAAAFGYKRVYLESAPFMKSAHRIYEAAGFVDRAPYPEAEVPESFHERWRFMERDLGPRSES
jgi:GNAT superfamily N-acetyltransferase